MQRAFMWAAVGICALLAVGSAGAQEKPAAASPAHGAPGAEQGGAHGASGADLGRIAAAVEAVGGDTSDFRRIVTSAKNKVFPAVVYIRCLRSSHERGERVAESVGGSGVLISAKGELITNWHVVDKAATVRCQLYDGRAFDAKVIGSDKDTDLAAVQLQLKSDGETVPFAEVGSTTGIREGEFVMAMGAPWGLNRSVSIGIISCIERFLEEQSEYSLWLQTDASISPGNSGGPLIDTEGRIIGINTLGQNMGGDMGFAVPAETMKLVIAQLREHGHMNWSWTGLQLQPLRDFARNMYFEGSEGVIVSAVDPNSPAEAAGILAKDRLLTLNGKPLTAVSEEALARRARVLGLLTKGEVAKLTLRRGDEEKTVELTPRAKGKVEGEELDCPRRDFTVKAINQFDNPDLYFHRKTGVFIFGVKMPGNAMNSGLRQQDIILQIEGQDVTTLADVRRIHDETLKAVGTKPRILFSVLRGGLTRQVVLDFSRDFKRE